jgi:hypothetical protein
LWQFWLGKYKWCKVFLSSQTSNRGVTSMNDESSM